MIQSKKELIADYRKGLLRDAAALPMSNTHSIVIIEADDENVFGYWGTNESTNDFFKRKVYVTEEDAYFKIGTHKFSLGEFMRIR
jgi:hypothetical protein